jgi:hypothetical protein
LFGAAHGASRLNRRAQRLHAILAPDPADERGNDGMQMEMLVRVDVVEAKSSRLKALKLGGDLQRDLVTDFAAGRDRDTRRDHVLTKISGGVDKIRHRGGGRDRPAVDQCQVQTDFQRGERPGTAHRVGSRRARHHQTRRGENTVAVGGLNRLVDLRCKPEIVGGDDQLLQRATLRRSRRNSKNSRPSRRRRCIMCGLASISATIAAIFVVRK